ncbi:MAG: hypothetical protein NT099_04670 [Candidatus Saganbacteria bacterium]|nr:hypothetical protein [Candidatus Saganbacteria bacterium]
MPNVLFISNGFAEDLGAIAIIKELHKLAPEIRVYVLPIVGDAKHFNGLNVEVIGPHWELPSQGFIHEKEHYNVFMDIKAGAIPLLLGQIWAVLKNRNKFDLIVGIGDYVSIMVNGLLIKKPFFYVWVTLFPVYPKSAIKYMQKYGLEIFPRDINLSHLDRSRVPKQYLGNPIMDAFEIKEEDFGITSDEPVVGILPGSRNITYKTLPLLAQIINNISSASPAYFLIAVSPKLDRHKVEGIISPILKTSKVILSDQFGDILNQSDVIIGLGGTGCEQAACMGKPVITFWGEGISRSRQFVEGHAYSILKESAILVEPDADKVAEAALNLLKDPERMLQMGQAGKRLMGPRGASKLIAQKIVNYFKQ